MRSYRWVTHVISIALVIWGAHAMPSNICRSKPTIPRTSTGDTHLHTRNSADAYSLGNLNMTPADALRFAARGGVDRAQRYASAAQATARLSSGV